MVAHDIEMVKSLVADTMLENPAITPYKMRQIVKGVGYKRTPKSDYSMNDIKSLMEDVRNEWAEQQMETRIEAKRRQLREIAYIKAKLHENGDYKTLAHYLKLEREITGTDIETQEEREMVRASARILALEAARKEEERLLGINRKHKVNENEVTGDFLEIIQQ